MVSLKLPLTTFAPPRPICIEGDKKEGNPPNLGGDDDRTQLESPLLLGRPWILAEGKEGERERAPFDMPMEEEYYMAKYQDSPRSGNIFLGVKL